MRARGHQHTLASPAKIEGHGLHTGKRAIVHLCPAPPDYGLVFIRTDLPGSPEIAVNLDAVHADALARRTELVGQYGSTVTTVEHLLAACRGLGLDNARIDLHGPEIPILDGSSQPFVEAICDAGLTNQRTDRSFLQLRRPVVLASEEAEITAIPAERMQLTFFAELTRAGVPDQVVTFTLGSDDFQTCLAPARTFVFYEDVEKLRSAGLIRGGSLECAIVLKDGAPYQTEYRMSNELACHKLLDLLGDLAILGKPLGALITARATGHAFHYAFMTKMIEELC